MKSLSLCIILFFSYRVFCQNWAWNNIYYSDTANTSAWASVNATTVDVEGNLYSVGEFGGGMTINNIYYPWNSSIQLFIIKSFQNGGVQWSKVVGGTGQIYATGIVCDDSGFFYITGSFAGTINFDSVQVSSAWGRDPYIAKYDSEGNFLWVSFAHGIVADDHSYSIAISKQGFLYITGFFYGNILFGNHWINSNGYTDIFIAKCDGEGNFLWARNAGASNYDDYGQAIATDDSGNVYATGSFQGSGKFGPFILQSFGSSDIYVTKINNEGDFIWAKNFGGTSGDGGSGISVSNQGDIAITGSFYSGINGAHFDNHTIFSNGGADAFLAKLNSNSSDVVWVRNIGGLSGEVGKGVVFDSNLDICFIENFWSSITFPDTIINSYGTADFLVCKYDKYGNYNWAKSYGTTGYDRVRNISIDKFNNLYISGAINGYYSPVVSTVKDGFLGKMINQIVPVELTSFTATISLSKVQLSWFTASELNNHGFEIERSLNKTNWVTIGFTEGKGTTSEPQSYTFSDDISEISAQKLFYRLKQIDFNGSFEYSNIVEVEIVPTEFSLSQNYPNPFNPSTTIQYAISSRQFVTLKVFDIIGNEIVTLVNEEKPAGDYKVEFQSSVGNLQLASGIYYYQLRAGNYLETKKMILIK